MRNMRLELDPSSREFLHRLGDINPDYAEKLTSLSLWALNELKRRTPRSKNVGIHLADSWVREVEKVNDNVTAVVMKNVAPHAEVVSFLEYGTKPHRIPTTGNKVMVFRVRGETIFASVVHHPGTRPYRILAGTKEALDVEIQRAGDQFLTSIVNEAAK